MIKQLVLLSIALLFFTSANGQNPPQEFFLGMDLLASDLVKAKKEFKIAYQKDSLFHGSSHFLGVIYLRENSYDSAVYFLKKSISLSTENVNHTKEMTYVRLIDAHLNSFNFNNAFSTAWDAFLDYPDNNVIARSLKDICLWSFYIRHNKLDSSYLSSMLKNEYIVNSVPEEYLIMRRIRIDDNALSVISQRVAKIKKKDYDIISCSYIQGKEPIDIRFFINWDMNKYFGGHVADTKSVYEDSNKPIYERIGALLVDDSKIDLNREIKKLLNE